MTDLRYTPHVVVSIDYDNTDDATESGFSETYSDKITVTMKRTTGLVPDGTTAEIEAIKENLQKLNNALEGMQ